MLRNLIKEKSAHKTELKSYNNIDINSIAAFNSDKLVTPYYGVALLREHFNNILVKSPHIKYVNINDHFVAESTNRGSAATFARHSCNPNCQLRNIYLPSGECASQIPSY